MKLTKEEFDANQKALQRLSRSRDVNKTASSKALSSSTFKGKSAYEANAQRTFLIHLERLQNAQPSGPFMDPPRDLSFLESKVSKNYSNERQGKVVLRENLQLLKRLALIQSESVEARLEKYMKRNVGPPVQSVRFNVRMREQDEITRENLRLLRRLQTVESEYTLSKFKRERKNIVRLMNMRRQDHTRGHLFASGPVTVGSHAKFERMAETERKQQNKANVARTKLLEERRKQAEETHRQVPSQKSLRRGQEQRSLPAVAHSNDGSMRSTASDDGDLYMQRNVDILPPLERHAAEGGPRTQAHAHTPSQGDAQGRREGGGPGSKRAHGIGRGMSKRPGARASPSRSSISEASTRYASPDSRAGRTRAGRSSHDSRSDGTVTLAEQDKAFVVATPSGVRTLNCKMSVVATHPFTQDTLLTFSVSEDEETVLGQVAVSLPEAKAITQAWEEKKTEEAEEREDDEAVLQRLYERLGSMFREADEDQSGLLDREEFLHLLEDAELGITANELQIVLSEADEDVDGQIDYEEFLPIAIDLVQSFRARQVAQEKRDKQEIEVSDEALVLLYSGHVDKLVQKVLDACKKVDTYETNAMTRAEFKNALKHSAMDLTRVEMNMVLASMPHDTFGRIKYLEFARIMYQVRFTTIKNSIMETRATDTEKLLMRLCKEEEQKTLASMGSVDSNGDTEPPFTGLITTMQLNNVLMNVKLSLNRLQVTSVMCEADAVDGMVDYWKFVPVGAKAIERMNDPRAIQQKAELMRQEPIAAEDFLKGKNEEELRDQMFQLFEHYDTDNSGELDKEEFQMCLESLELGLTAGQINALMVVADTDHTGLIDREEFMEFGFHHLMHLQREKHMGQIQDSLEAKAPGPNGSTSGANAGDDGAMFRALFEPVGEGDSDSMEAMEKDLITIFTRADKEGLGYLTAEAFREVIMAMQLGLSPYHVAVLMTEADINADGMIQYSEFVPVGLKMLYSFKAKTSALRKWRVREREAEVKAEGLMHSIQGQLDSVVHEMDLSFHAADQSGGMKVLPAETFQRCLEDPRVGLPKQEVCMILSRMRPDKSGFVSYKNFRLVMREARRVSVKRKILEDMPSSTLEKHLIQLFHDQAEDKEAWGMGAVPISDVYRVMVDAKYLNLNRLQLMAVMSLETHCCIEEMDISAADGLDGDDVAVAAEPNDRKARLPAEPALRSPAHKHTDALDSASSLLDGGRPTAGAEGLQDDEDVKLDIWKFASCSAEMISKFFDVQEIERKTKLLSNAKFSSTNVLGGLQQSELVKKLTFEFRQRDKRRTGMVSAEDFIDAIRPIRQLRFDEDDLLALAQAAPHAEDSDEILWREWMNSAYDTVLDYGRKRCERESEVKRTTSVMHRKEGPQDEISSSMLQTISNEILGLLDLKGNTPDRPSSPSSEATFSLTFRLPSDGNSVAEGLRTQAESLGIQKSASINGSRRNTRRMSHLVSSDKTSSYQLALTSSMMQQNDTSSAITNSSTMFRVSRACKVVNEHGALLATDLTSTTSNAAKAAKHLIMAEVRASATQPSHVDVAVFNVTLNEEYIMCVKLPTLAVVDLDTAFQWATQLCNSIHVLQDTKGVRKIDFAQSRRPRDSHTTGLDETDRAV